MSLKCELGEIFMLLWGFGFEFNFETRFFLKKTKSGKPQIQLRRQHGRILLQTKFFFNMSTSGISAFQQVFRWTKTELDHGIYFLELVLKINLLLLIFLMLFRRKLSIRAPQTGSGPRTPYRCILCFKTTSDHYVAARHIEFVHFVPFLRMFLYICCYGIPSYLLLGAVQTTLRSI